MTTEEQRAALHEIAEVCHEMEAGHHVLSAVHAENTHAVCKHLFRKHLDLMARIREIITMHVSNFSIVFTLTVLQLIQRTLAGHWHMDRSTGLCRR